MTNRELDVLIAEKIFGSKVAFPNQKAGWRIDYVADLEECNDPIVTDMGYDGYRLKRYSQDVKAAFEMVEKFRTAQRVFCLATVVQLSDDPSMEWLAKWEMLDPDYRFVFSYSESAAKAICESALKVLEVKND